VIAYTFDSRISITKPLCNFGFCSSMHRGCDGNNWLSRSFYYSFFNNLGRLIKVLMFSVACISIILVMILARGVFFWFSLHVRPRWFLSLKECRYRFLVRPAKFHLLPFDLSLLVPLWSAPYLLPSSLLAVLGYAMRIKLRRSGLKAWL